MKGQTGRQREERVHDKSFFSLFTTNLGQEKECQDVQTDEKM